jgi:hypothetical protein
MSETIEYRVVFALSDFRRLGPQDRADLLAVLTELGYVIAAETVERWLSPFQTIEPSLVVRSDAQQEAVRCALACQGISSRVDQFDVIDAYGMR